MKKIVFALFILLVFNEISMADTVYENSRVLNHSQKVSQISSSTLYDNEDYTFIIEELKNQIALNPDNYILNTYLIDLYLRSGMYTQAHQELLFLNNLNENNKLSAGVITNIDQIKKSFLNKHRTANDKSITYLNLTLINLILNNVQQAEKTIIAASKKITNETLFAETLNCVFAREYDIDKALVAFDKMLLNYPNNVAVKKMKALYLKCSNRIKESIKEYNSALALAPDDEEIIYELYRIYFDKNYSAETITKKIFGRSNKEKGYLTLTELLLSKNEIENAEVFAERLVHEFPNNVDGIIALSETYRRGGKLKDSYEVLKDARDKADTEERIAKYNVILAKLSDEPLKEADSLMNNGLYAQALDVLKEANPDNLYVILSKSRANYFLKNKRTALEYLNKAMSLYPNNADVLYYFAFYFYQEQDMLNAKKYINQVLEVNSEHEYALKLLDLINKIEADKLIDDINSAIEMQNYSEAMRLTNEALNINPKDDNLYFYKGQIYIAMNDYYLATAPFYKALEINKNNPLTYYYLGLCFDNLSENENALMYYKQFLDILPTDEYGESEKIKYAQVRIEKLTPLVQEEAAKTSEVTDTDTDTDTDTKTTTESTKKK